MTGQVNPTRSSLTDKLKLIKILPKIKIYHDDFLKFIFILMLTI